MSLRELLFAWCTVVCLCGCGRDEGSLGMFNDIVDSDADSRYKLGQLSFTMNIQDKEGRFVCLENVDSVELRVNGRKWGIFTSEKVDTVGRSVGVVDGVRVAASRVDYLVLAPYRVDFGRIETAGDVVYYLKERMALTPGDYVCEIARLKFKDENGEWVELKPQLYKDFKVVENTSASFVGDVVITLNR